MNVLISVNYEYMDKAVVMLSSLIRRTKEPVHIYLLNYSLSDSNVIAFRKQINAMYSTEVHTINLSQTPFDDMPVMDHFSVEMYFRILAQFLLPKELDRILWLDADIAILQDLSSFYHQELENFSMVACADVNDGQAEVERLKVNIGLPNEHVYFNSGVLLLNLALLRETTSMENICEVAYALKDKLKYPDQDLLNYLYKNRVKYADGNQYNYQMFYGRKPKKEERKHISILHFVGSGKPWKHQYINEMSIYWWREAVILPGNKMKMICCYFCSIFHKLKVLVSRCAKYALETTENS